MDTLPCDVVNVIAQYCDPVSMTMVYHIFPDMCYYQSINDNSLVNECARYGHRELLLYLIAHGYHYTSAIGSTLLQHGHFELYQHMIDNKYHLSGIGVHMMTDHGCQRAVDMVDLPLIIKLLKRNQSMLSNVIDYSVGINNVKCIDMFCNGDLTSDDVMIASIKYGNMYGYNKSKSIYWDDQHMITAITYHQLGMVDQLLVDGYSHSTGHSNIFNNIVLDCEYVQQLTQRYQLREDLVNICIKREQLELVKILIPTYTFNNYIFKYAVTYPLIIEFLLDNGYQPYDSVIQSTILSGHTNIVKIFASRLTLSDVQVNAIIRNRMLNVIPLLTFNPDSIISAVGSGNVDVVKLLVGSGCQLTTKCMSTAIYTKNYQMFQWLIKNNCPVDDSVRDMTIFLPQYRELL